MADSLKGLAPYSPHVIVLCFVNPCPGHAASDLVNPCRQTFRFSECTGTACSRVSEPCVYTGPMRTLFLEAWLHPSLRLVGAGIQQELRHCHVAIAGCTQQSGETSAWAGAA